MPLDIVEIRKLAEYYATDLYGGALGEQAEDDTYINDKFKTPIKKPHREFRSGIGRRMVDAPAEQIVSSNPQVEIVMMEETQKAQEIIKRLSFEANQHWIQILKRQNPNPFKESIKNKCGRGISYIQVMHNGDYTNDGLYYGLPVKYLLRDPMTIFGSLDEDCNGIPKNVIIKCDRLCADVKYLYPDWGNPSKRGRWGTNKMVKWLEYWDDTYYYREADGEPVTKDIERHNYGITPFVRRYSGFGRESQDGDPASLIVSSIRFCRDLILEECMLRSDLASRAHIYAHEPTTIIAQEELNKDQAYSMKWGADDVNVLDKTGGRVDIIRGNMTAPPVELYNRLSQIQNEIVQRCPYLAAGFPMGTSGRQDDIAFMAAKRAYETVIENTENEWATALEIGLKYICKLDGYRPPRLKESDLDADFQVRVKLKAPDPIEEDRLSLSGRTQVQMGQLSLRSNLIKFQGLTEDEADDEIDEILAERYMFQSPDIAEYLQVKAMEESGMYEDVQALKQRRMELERKIKEFPLGAQFGSQGGEPRTGNIQSPAGIEQSTYQRGQRVPPGGM